MLSPKEIAAIKAEIKKLEELRGETSDTGVRERIEAWIEEQKQKLASRDRSNSAPR